MSLFINCINLFFFFLPYILEWRLYKLEFQFFVTNSIFFFTMLSYNNDINQPCNYVIQNPLHYLRMWLIIQNKSPPKNTKEVIRQKTNNFLGGGKNETISFLSAESKWWYRRHEKIYNKRKKQKVARIWAVWFSEAVPPVTTPGPGEGPADYTSLTQRVVSPFGPEQHASGPPIAVKLTADDFSRASRPGSEVIANEGKFYLGADKLLFPPILLSAWRNITNLIFTPKYFFKFNLPPSLFLLHSSIAAKPLRFPNFPPTPNKKKKVTNITNKNA